MVVVVMLLCCHVVLVMSNAEDCLFRRSYEQRGFLDLFVLVLVLFIYSLREISNVRDATEWIGERCQVNSSQTLRQTFIMLVVVSGQRDGRLFVRRWLAAFD